jgi:hypothetical protein
MGGRGNAETRQLSAKPGELGENNRVEKGTETEAEQKKKQKIASAPSIDHHCPRKMM